MAKLTGEVGHIVRLRVTLTCRVSTLAPSTVSVEGATIFRLI